MRFYRWILNPRLLFRIIRRCACEGVGRLCPVWQLACKYQVDHNQDPATLLLLGMILVSILNRRKVEGIRLFIEITVKFFWDNSCQYNYRVW